MKIFQEEIINKWFTILNHENTKPNTKGESHIIDHILTSHPHLNVNTTTVKHHYSDHFMVTTNRLTKHQVNTPRYTQTRPYNKIDYNILCTNISNDPQLGVILNTTNIDEIAQGIIDLISYHLNSCAPLRTIQVKKKDIQPISEESRSLIQRRDEAWDQYVSTNDLDILRDYRHIKSRVNKSLKNDKLTAQSKINSEAVKSRDMWKNAKQQLGWIQHGGPKMIVKDGSPITSPQRMADELNVNYILSAAKTRRSIPKNTGDPILNFKKLTKDKNLNLSFHPIGRIELYKTIQSINPSKSSALDGISMKFLNRIKEPLMEVILHMVNTSIIQSTYPNPLKKTKVIPLLKKDKDPTSPDSYTGINLIP